MSKTNISIGEVIIPTPHNVINYGRYLSDINKFNLLTVDEEIEFFTKYHAGELRYYNIIAERNLRFVISVAKKFQSVVAHATITLEDLISEGNYGLCEAIQKFDHTKGFKFISYAVHYIKMRILECISTNFKNIRIPINRQSLLTKLNRVESQLQQQYQYEIDSSTLQEYALQQNIITNSESYQISQMKIDAIEESSLSTIISDNLTLNDLLSDSSQENGHSMLLSEERKTFLQNKLSQIPPIVATFFEMYYGLNNTEQHSMNEIANKLNVKHSTVHFQIQRWTKLMNKNYKEEYKQYQ